MPFCTRGSTRLQRGISLLSAGGRMRVTELSVSSIGADRTTGLQKQKSHVYLHYLGIKMLCCTALAPACEKQPPLWAALNQSRERIQLLNNTLSMFFLQEGNILAGSQCSSLHSIALGQEQTAGTRYFNLILLPNTF